MQVRVERLETQDKSDHLEGQESQVCLDRMDLLVCQALQAHLDSLVRLVFQELQDQMEFQEEQDLKELPGLLVWVVGQALLVTRVLKEILVSKDSLGLMAVLASLEDLANLETWATQVSLAQMDPLATRVPLALQALMDYPVFLVLLGRLEEVGQLVK